MNVQGLKALGKKELKSILGSGTCYPFFHLGSCKYDCNCTSKKATQVVGASQYCLLNYPYIITNASQCGGGSDDGGGGDIYI